MADVNAWALGFGWLTVVGGLLVHRDMCLGGGKRFPDPEPAPDTGPADSSTDTGKDAHLRRPGVPCSGATTRRAPRPTERVVAHAAPVVREKV